MKRNFGVALVLFLTSFGAMSNTLAVQTAENIHVDCGPNKYATTTRLQGSSYSELEISVQCLPLICRYQKSQDAPFSIFSNQWRIFLSPQLIKSTSNGLIKYDTTPILKLRVLDESVSESDRNLKLTEYLKQGLCESSELIDPGVSSL